MGSQQKNSQLVRRTVRPLPNPHGRRQFLTDSVRCTKTSPNTFSCDVLLVSEPEKSAGESLEAVPQSPPAQCQSTSPPPSPSQTQSAATAPPAENPAVSALVSRFVSRTVFPAPPPPLISGAALLKCASSEIGIVLAAAGGKGSLVSALAMLKAGLDAGACLSLVRDEAAQRNAEDACVARGGVVTGVEGNKTICEIRETVK